MSTAPRRSRPICSARRRGHREHGVGRPRVAEHGARGRVLLVGDQRAQPRARLDDDRHPARPSLPDDRGNERDAAFTGCGLPRHADGRRPLRRGSAPAEPNPPPRHGVRSPAQRRDPSVMRPAATPRSRPGTPAVRHQSSGRVRIARAVVRHRHGVLPVRGPAAVRRDDRPAVVELAGLRVARGQHRLDGQRHAPARAAGPARGHRGWAGTGPCASRVPMPWPPYSCDDAVGDAVAPAGRLGGGLHGVRDVGQPRARRGPPRSRPAAPPRHAADRARSAGAPVPTASVTAASPCQPVDDRPAVDRQQVAVGEDLRRSTGCRARSARSPRRRSTPGSRGSRGTTARRRRPG